MTDILDSAMMSGTGESGELPTGGAGKDKAGGVKKGGADRGSEKKKAGDKTGGAKKRADVCRKTGGGKTEGKSPERGQRDEKKQVSSRVGKSGLSPEEREAAAEAAAWYRSLKETTNETFFPLFFDEHRFLVLMGGAGSGKSIFAGRKILERAVSEAGHRFLVVRKVAKTLRTSCYEQLTSQLGRFYPEAGWTVNKSDMSIHFPNGSAILMTGVDDSEKLKSIFGITGMWIEEASELEQADFEQLNLRLRDACPHYKQMILSFNPVSSLHWLKSRFFDREDPEVLTHRSSYRDNRFLSEDYCRRLEKYRDIDPYYYAVYCLGEWGTTGKSVFQSMAVTRRLADRPQPKAEVSFVYSYDGLEVLDIRTEPMPDGIVKIYREPDASVPYVIGADTAGEGSDWCVGQVLDNTTGEQVAVLRMRGDEDVFARQLYCLGRYYNNALIALETNFSTYPVMELERLRYPRQYVRESFDEYTHRPKSSYGFVTDRKTRPVMIANLIAFMREHPESVNDRVTLEEMLTFVRNESLRQEAEAGAHDDCVMALCIAHMARGQQSFRAEKSGQAVKKPWTADMWEDWRRAAPAERRYLREKWGEPLPPGRGGELSAE